ncbi:MAG: alpha/beta fold hydrolase [Clostridia bacterium]|nr:alpha/beta fold hydrolase [Clostridia bacterium]
MVIMDDGIRLNAQLDMPASSEGKHPLVIIIHGFTGHMEERHIVAVSRTLNEIGFATLRVDMYGHGKSGGRFEDHTLYKWLSNALRVIDYARSLDHVTDLYLCGHSQGGMTVMLAGAMKHDVIKGIIPLSPALMIPEEARKGTLLGQDFDPDHIPEVLPAWGDRGLNGNYVRVAQTIHVEDAIDRYDGPVLIVHGDEDEAVPVGYGVKAAERYKNCDLVLIPGDTHCYDHHLDQVLDAVRDWMRGRA